MVESIQSGIPAASGKQPDSAVVFLSYAREDKDFALHLADALRLKGLEAQGDWELLRGVAYELQLQDLQLGADTRVLILSPDSVRSSPCCAELECADEQKKRILLVVFIDVGLREMNCRECCLPRNGLFSAPLTISSLASKDWSRPSTPTSI